LLKWALLEVCLPSPVYDSSSAQRQLELVLQETGLATIVDVEYTNPFSELALLQQMQIQQQGARAQALELKRALARQMIRIPQASKDER
jgi:hypothetical protein